MKSRAEIDAIAWRTLEEQVPHSGQPPCYEACKRPANLIELSQMIADTDDFECSWSEFISRMVALSAVILLGGATSAELRARIPSWASRGSGVPLHTLQAAGPVLDGGARIFPLRRNGTS